MTEGGIDPTTLDAARDMLSRSQPKAGVDLEELLEHSRQGAKIYRIAARLDKENSREALKYARREKEAAKILKSMIAARDDRQ